MSTLALLLIGSVAFVSCDNDDDDDQGTPTNDIMNVLSVDPDYSLLVAALEQTNLDQVLSSPGPFTLFAPDNSSMQAFLASAGYTSLADVPADVLGDVLTYHVLGAAVESSDLENFYVTTANAALPGNNQVGTSMYINVDNGVVINGNASVTNADIVADNGIIHEVDQVIELPTVVTFALADPNFTSLTTALTTPGLPTDFVDVLTGDGPFTVFAPTNAAFEALIDSDDNWNSPSDIPSNVLDLVLKYHVTDAGNVRSTDLTDGMTVNTLAAEDFTIDLSGDVPVINAGNNTANIVATDVQAKNGVIHVIDTVLLP